MSGLAGLLGPAQNFATLILLGLRLRRPLFHPSAEALRAFAAASPPVKRIKKGPLLKEVDPYMASSSQDIAYFSFTIISS